MHRTLLAVFVIAGLYGCKSSPEPAAAQPPAEEATSPAGDNGSNPPQTAPPIVIADADAEHRTAPSGKAQIIKLATGQNAFLGKLEMDGGGKVPTHRDATEEYIYILEGSGVMKIDGKTYEVGPNTAVYMPANAEVSFDGGPDKLVAIQVFSGPEPSAKYDAWTPASSR